MTNLSETTKFIPDLQKNTADKGPILSLEPNEVITTTWVFSSWKEFKQITIGDRAWMQSLIEERNSSFAKIPITREKLNSLASIGVLSLRSIWGLSSPDGDTKNIINEFESSDAFQSVRTQFLNEKQKDLFGISHNIAAVTIIRLNPESPILRQVKSLAN